MIYYNIQHYGSLDNLKPLLKLIGHKRNHIYLSYDSSECGEHYASDELPIIQYDFSSLYGSFRHGLSSNISWGGFSLTTAMINALKRSLEVKDWKYFINLSGRCIPLCKQENIFKKLNAYSQEGYESFCYYFEPQQPMQWFSEEKNMSIKLSKYGRVGFMLDKKFSRSISMKEFDPTHNVMHRIAASFKELDKNIFNISGLDIKKIAIRDSFFREEKFLVGRQWVILSRKQVEWLVTSEFVERLLEILSDVFISDEIFFQMALNSKHNPYRSSVASTSLRFNEAAACTLDQALMVEALKSDNLFARKVTSEGLKILIQGIDGD